jgi:hypothetical protein
MISSLSTLGQSALKSSYLNGIKKNACRVLPSMKLMGIAPNKRFYSIDVHTHMYTPKYMDILRRRTDIPRVIKVAGNDRLVILTYIREETGVFPNFLKSAF